MEEAKPNRTDQLAGRTRSAALVTRRAAMELFEQAPQAYHLPVCRPGAAGLLVGPPALAPRACPCPEDCMRLSLPDAKSSIALMAVVLVAGGPGTTPARGVTLADATSAQAPAPPPAAPQAAADPQALLKEIAQLR